MKSAATSNSTVQNKICHAKVNNDPPNNGTRSCPNLVNVGKGVIFQVDIEDLYHKVDDKVIIDCKIQRNFCSRK